jgi:hypothetical protein
VGWTIAVAAVLAALLGFMAGLATFKRSNRWCPVCGGTLTCLACGRDRSATSRPVPGATKPLGRPA